MMGARKTLDHTAPRGFYVRHPDGRFTGPYRSEAEARETVPPGASTWDYDIAHHIGDKAT